MTFTDAEAQRLLRIVDEQVERALSRRPRTAYGIVASLDNTTARATVNVLGESTASAGFVYPRHMSPLVGDVVRVVIDPRGERYIEQTYGPGGGSPSGAISAYGGSSAPAGWLLCQGQSLLRTDYPALFVAIGTTYGAVDGTHFTLPNLQQRFPLGKAASGTGSTLGGTGGSIDHTHTGPSHDHSITHTHTSASHSHPLDDGGWAQVMMTVSGGNAIIRLRRITAGTGYSSNFQTGNIAGSAATGTSETVAVALDGDTASTTPGSTGGSSAANTGFAGTGSTGSNNPPYQVVNYIIKI
jgi:microcystin-dependent protein